MSWLSLGWLVGCGGPSPDPSACVDLSLSLPDGSPDGCDLAACVTCAEACDGPCLVLESFPPQYECEGGGSWDVYDFCPDWTPLQVEEPRVEDVVDLGCGMSSVENLQVVPTGPGAVAVVHTDYADGCCPLSVEVALDAVGSALTVSYTPIDDFCDCVCGLDVSYDLVGLGPGSWTLTAGASALQTTFTLP